MPRRYLLEFEGWSKGRTKEAAHETKPIVTPGIPEGRRGRGGRAVGGRAGAGRDGSARGGRGTEDRPRGRPSSAPAAAFKLKYGPPLGMFEASAGKAPLDQLKFMADQGFRAWFDNGLGGRPVAEQEALAKESARLGLSIGPFVAYADFPAKTFVLRDKAVHDMLAGKLKAAIDTAKRTGCQWTLIVPGHYDESLDWDYQTANVVENLKWCAGVVEPAGLGHRPRAAQPQGPPGPVPDEDGPGRRDLPGRRQPLPARSSTTSTTSRSPRGTSSPTSTPAGTRSPPSTSATRRAGRSRARARSTTGTSSSTSTTRAIRASCAWSTARASRARTASGPSSTPTAPPTPSERQRRGPAYSRQLYL